MQLLIQKYVANAMQHTEGFVLERALVIMALHSLIAIIMLIAIKSKIYAHTEEIGHDHVHTKGGCVAPYYNSVQM